MRKLVLGQEAIISKNGFSCDNNTTVLTLNNDEDRNNLCLTASGLIYCHVCVLKVKDEEDKVVRMVGWHIGNKTHSSTPVDAAERYELSYNYQCIRAGLEKLDQEIPSEITQAQSNGHSKLSLSCYAPILAGPLNQTAIATLSETVFQGICNIQQRHNLEIEHKGVPSRDIAVFADRWVPDALICRNEVDDTLVERYQKYVETVSKTVSDFIPSR